jgi:hypothetical protein
MSILCQHQPQISAQVQPTIDLLNHLDAWHPEVLLQHQIQPTDYKNGLVFRSVIESIRGTFIASSTTGREGLVADVLENLKRREWIAEYKKTSGKSRYDFEIALADQAGYFAYLEVKGGEGNSINISERPLAAKEFGVWCHLDGAIVNQPAHGVHSIINRLTNELVIRHKQVDMAFFKDVLCGTRTRPCPKYPAQEESIGLLAAPDIFLFPQRIPTRQDPEPPVHTLETLQLPKLILDLFGAGDYAPHVWAVQVKIAETDDGRIQHRVEVWHQGRLIDSSRSRAFIQAKL